jgi:putative transposase
MKGFDYSSDNLYFVTMCVQDRLCCLGSVILIESAVGTGRDLSVHHPNESNPNESNPNESNPNESNPNGFLKKMELNKLGEIVRNRMYWLSEQYQYVDIHNFVIMPNHVHAIIEIDSKKSAGANRGLSVQSEEIKIKSLSGLIGAFKTTSSKIIHEYGFLDFTWQRSFHDHIIRNEKSYLNISNYIDSNPDKWTVDTFFEKT